MQCKTETGMSLLGGALLGAAAMYFLDPENGPDRRHLAGDKAGGAWDKAKGWGSSLADHAGDAASTVATGAAGAWESARDSDIGDRAHGLGHRAAGAASRAWDAMTHWGSSAAGSARDATHSARHRLARAIDSDVESSTGAHVAGYTATAVGTLALGAAAMYFFDAAQGRRRRAECGDKLSSIVRRAGRAFNRTGRHVMNRVRGRSHEARQMFGSSADDVSGEQLLQRCRSELGHAISRPADVQLMADAGGVVTVYGRCAQAEVDRLTTTLSGVRGVTQVVNRLEDDASSTPGGSSAHGAYATSMPSTGGTTTAPQT